MNVNRFCCFLLALILFLNGIPGFAFETDQFNLPPLPLADIGEEVTEYVQAALLKALEKTNAEITASEACLGPSAKKEPGCGSVETERAKLKHLRSNDAVAHALFKEIGDGSLVITKFGKWIKDHKFRAQPSSYKTGYAESIFVAAPLDYATISPTINMYGVEFGTDKLEHFFQQGFEYYEIRRKAELKGTSRERGVRQAVSWGQKTERTYFGTMVSGVYSNADLYANYAGMRFYDGLSNSLKIGDQTRPAIVELREGLWHLSVSPAAFGMLVRPFLTDHLNEALNPSAYLFTLVRSVRRKVQKHGCPEWRKRYPDATVSAINDKARALELWHDEDYGFTQKGRMVRLAETCFADRTDDKAAVLAR